MIWNLFLCKNKFAYSLKSINSLNGHQIKDMAINIKGKFSTFLNLEYSPE